MSPLKLSLIDYLMSMTFFTIANLNKIYTQGPKEISAIHQPTAPSFYQDELHCYVSEMGDTFFTSIFISVSMRICVT